MPSVSQDPAKSKRPTDSAFKQQRLPAWQPILTAGTVLPTFFIIGVAFIPIGVGLMYFSDMVKEFSLDYTQCRSDKLPDRTCADLISNVSNTIDCTCRINFTLPSTFKGKVYMYYGLTNFYQNHRRYVKSRDDTQLLGVLKADPSNDCDPYRKSDGKPIAPCGAIANSLFNDTLQLLYLSNNTFVNISLLNTGIAWESDKNVKFRNPPGKDLQSAFKGFTKPVNWKRNVWELDPDNESNNGFQNEDLIVWMRTAALPNFRKLYRRVNATNPLTSNGLPSGTYQLLVNYRFGVVAFEGTKRIIISTTSVIGGRNPFLGFAYIVVGGICFLLGAIFLFIHNKCGKSTTEVININPLTTYQE